MDENQYNKLLKEVKIFLIILAIIVIINTILIITTQIYSINPMLLIGSLIFYIFIMFTTYRGMKDLKMYGPICGIILSIILIISLDIISVAWGILFVFDCIKMIKYIKQ